MALTLKLPIKFPFFSPPIDPNPTDGPTQTRPSTEVRFSRWGNANAAKFEQRRRAQEEIEADIRLTRRFTAIENITSTASSSSSSAAVDTFKSTGTPSAPSRPSIPGKRSKYSKPPPPPKEASDSNSSVNVLEIPDKRFRLPPPVVKIGEDGVSYFIDGAPFEFKYSYTETPPVKPIRAREPPYVPFGPQTMRRPWTGRIPKENRPFVVPPPPGMYMDTPTPMSREEVLGEPLREEELNGLIEATMKTSRVLYIGRDGFTHNMLENIHSLWKWKKVCKIKCKGVCTVDMDNVCQQLEERTGGKIIYRKGGTVHLFRGRNYNYRARPRFPLMLWKPVPPVYPRLIRRVPKGLTLKKATEMRRKGRNLMPICKLGKNGVYCDLVANVREAFGECELVRINCQGLNESDYRRIGAKLRDVVPCILLSFDDEHILMWRGQNWRPSSPNLRDDCEESTKIVADSENSTQELSAPCLQKTSADHVNNESQGISISSSSGYVSLTKVEVTYPIENSNPPVSQVSRAASLPMRTYEVETLADVTGFSGEPQPCGSADPSMTIIGTDGNSVNGIVNPHSGKLRLDSGSAIADQPSRSAASFREGVLLLLEQAVEKGRALVLDDESLDADNIYKTTLAFAKSAPSGPVFKVPRRVWVRGDKQEDSTLESKEISRVSMEGKKGNISKIEKKGKCDKLCLNVVPQRTVDLLARLL